MLSVIIVSRNGRDLLADCLRSLDAGVGGLPYETIIVDNASTDGSVDMIAREWPQAKLICNDRNVGFGSANNQGFRLSIGEYAVFLNSDTRVGAGSLSRLVQFMENHPQAGACGPRLHQANGQIQPFAFGSDPTPGYLLRRGAARLIFGRPIHDWTISKCQGVDWVSGACLLVRREALEQVGGFDDKFFMYFEDNDLCLRIRRAGWKVLYNPLVSIVHIGGASLASQVDRTRWYDASLRYFYTKHYSAFARLLLELMLPFYRRMA